MKQNKGQYITTHVELWDVWPQGNNNNHLKKKKKGQVSSFFLFFVFIPVPIG